MNAIQNNKLTPGFIRWVRSLIFILVLVCTAQAQNKIKALPDDSIATTQDRQFVQRTYELAKNAAAHGNYPFGALLVHEGKIVAEFENETTTSGDVTKHAETGLISNASKKLSRKILSESTLYTSTEPCLMCTGAIYWARIPKVVFGTSEHQMDLVNDAGSKDHRISSRDAFRKIKPETIIIGPLLEKEGLAIHAAYRKELRKRPKN